MGESLWCGLTKYEAGPVQDHFDVAVFESNRSVDDEEALAVGSYFVECLVASEAEGGVEEGFGRCGLQLA